MMDPNRIKELIESQWPECTALIFNDMGDGEHFAAEVVSSAELTTSAAKCSPSPMSLKMSAVHSGHWDSMSSLMRLGSIMIVFSGVVSNHRLCDSTAARILPSLL